MGAETVTNRKHTMKINLVLSLVLALSLLAKAGDAPKPDKLVAVPIQTVPLNDAVSRALMEVTLEGTGIDLAACDVTFQHTIIMDDEQGSVNVYQVVDRKSGSVFKIGIAFHVDRDDKQGI